MPNRDFPQSFLEAVFSLFKRELPVHVIHITVFGYAILLHFSDSKFTSMTFLDRLLSGFLTGLAPAIIIAALVTIPVLIASKFGEYSTDVYFLIFVGGINLAFSSLIVWHYFFPGLF